MKRSFLFMSKEPQNATSEDYTLSLEYVGDIFGTNVWKDKLVAGR